MSQRRAVAHLRDGTPQDIDPETVDGLLARPETLLWLDIESPTSEDILLLGKQFGFHELALEDADKRGQRPKVDEYEGYYFIVVYSTAVTDDRHVETNEIHCFWGPNYLVTLHPERVPEIEAAIHRWTITHEHRKHGVAYQVYALLDAIVDSHFPALDTIGERIGDVEERLLSGDDSIMEQALQLRREMLEFRRVMGASRDVMNVLVRRDIPIFPSALVPYLADVHDHAMRAVEGLEMQRDYLGNVIDAHLSIVSNRLNKSMLRLTSATVCVMLPAAIAGIYGMNFQHMPELEQAWGYPYALTLIFGSVGLALVIFRRIGWL